MKLELLKAMESYFGRDEKRINHARRVLGYAEQLLIAEEGDRQIVEAAAVLHDIGIHAAEKKWGSTAGKYQQIEGPPIAEQLLRRIGFPPEKIGAVLEIIAHHHTPGVIETINFKILYDADQLVNLPAEHDVHDRAKLVRLVNKVFLTKEGKALAEKNYLTGVDLTDHENH